MNAARIEYYKARRRSRSMCLRREDEGLPHHPDGSGWGVCPVCEGTGKYFDPFDDSGQSDDYCSNCNGDGVLPDGFRDPLVRMHEARRLRHMEEYREQYDKAWGRIIAGRNSGMACLRMCELAVGCEVQARDLVAAMKRVPA